MRKQIDFDVRVFPLGNGANDTMTRDAVSDFLKVNYLLKPNQDANGKLNPLDKSYWEIFHISTNQVSAGSIFYQVTLVKYDDTPIDKPVTK